jgi:hypothetical protein
MSERTWGEIEREIRDDYLRADGPENIQFRDVQWQVWRAEVERAAAAKARGEALIEVVQAHRDLHKTYGSTVACRGGIGGQALTSHCAEICYNAGAHEKELEAWQRLEVEAIDYSSARAEAYRQERGEQ